MIDPSLAALIRRLERLAAEHDPIRIYLFVHPPTDYRRKEMYECIERIEKPNTCMGVRWSRTAVVCLEEPHVLPVVENLAEVGRYLGHPEDDEDPMNDMSDWYFFLCHLDVHRVQPAPGYIDFTRTWEKIPTITASLASWTLDGIDKYGGMLTITDIYREAMEVLHAYAQQKERDAPPRDPASNKAMTGKQFTDWLAVKSDGIKGPSESTVRSWRNEADVTPRKSKSEVFTPDEIQAIIKVAASKSGHWGDICKAL